MFGNAPRSFRGKGRAVKYEELKEQIDGLGERQRRGCARVLSLVSLGGGVRSEFLGHLDGACLLYTSDAADE